MGLRTSLRFNRPNSKKNRTPSPSALEKSNFENNNNSSSVSRPEEALPPTQPLSSASSPLTESFLDASSTIKRRNRFSLRRRNKHSTAVVAQDDDKNDDVPLPPQNPIGELQDDTVEKKQHDDLKKPTTSTTRSSGLRILRRLSSPFKLQQFNSSVGDRESNSGGSKDTSEESHGFDSDENNALLNPLPAQTSNASTVVQLTTVLTESYSPPRHHHSDKIISPIMEEPIQEQDEDLLVQQRHKFECATAILQHSYFERLCGVGNNNSFDEEDKCPRKYTLPEDPTVQESIECIFASQLKNGLELWDDAEEEMSSSSTGSLERVSKRHADLVSPADLQQSRMNRKDRKNSADLSMNQVRKRYEQASLVYVGTFDPTLDQEEVMANVAKTSDGHVIEPILCPCHASPAPCLKPKDWPQAPILLRPTPGSTTRVKSIRFCGSKEPLWVPGSHLNWWQRLAQHWGRECIEEAHFPCCEHCVVCPVNNGNEASGESLVIDFESDLFDGTLLLRLRFIEGTTPEPYDDSKGYFNGVNRRYQTVVRGRFKKPLPLTHMVNGFRCDRRFGKLPAKWILRGGMKVLSFFAPQLDAQLEGDRPYSVTPLGSTAQSIAVDTPETLPSSMESGLCEPKEAHRTLIGQSSDAATSFQRAKLRKKVFDKYFVAKSQEPMADPSKIYTFEFLQHLFNFETFSIELGNMLGSVELEEVLDGQPLQIMAAFGEQPLWSFDVWHECLWERAREVEGK
ncbi:hypothetical protein IV203_010377 [Nitzschia inconspicua]|uniref:Domain of unknown function at the cortex 1 domain-containing protein n=1 Tax=Nitzschia inconspicua TaxID=303405 RepID=A0A9K3KW52_9STRA|nr:hypothetical protein IV203_010377 [Nitzschia inconspicua]